MVCKFCGQEIEDGSKFCPICGEKLEEEVVVEAAPVVEEAAPVVEENNTNVVVKERGPWKIFAILGYVFGIISICGCVIPGFGISFGVYGIVFAALGKKSLSANVKAKKGLTLSIVATVINVVVVFLISFVATLMNLLAGAAAGIQ